MKKKVAAIVLNSVLHDARVLKEAESLKNNGFDITIFGISDNNNSPGNYISNNGISIKLVDWQNKWYKESLIRRIILLSFTYLVLLGAGVALYKFFDPIDVLLIFGIAFSGYFILKILKNMAFLLIGFNKNDAIKQNGKEKIYPTKRIIFIILSILSDVRKILDFKNKIFRSNLFRKVFSDEIRKINPNIIHCHDLNTVKIGIDIAKITKSKIIYDSHEIFSKISSATKIWDKYYSWLEKRISKKVNAFITINDSIARYLKKQNPCLPDPVIICNATKISSSDYNYDGRLHEAAGLDRNKRILLFQGGFSPHRGLVQLVNSAPSLDSKWSIVLMGWGKIEEELKALAKVVDPSGEKISFVPKVPQSELLQWSTGATIGIIPYENVSLNHWYCTPNKLWEYPACWSASFV